MRDAPPPLAPGLTLEGRYRLDRVIGAGGFGVVYFAHHLTLDVAVAVKALQPRPDLAPEQRAMHAARFTDEAHILARLRHPNIARVLDFGVFEGDPAGSIPWFVLEWCEGEGLDIELGRRRNKADPSKAPRSIDEAWGLFRPVVDAIAYGHALGIAHRDLKPSNVMLVRDRHGLSPRVLDFGIAKRIEADTPSGDTLTASGGMLFTPGYAAPEQVAGSRTGPWTDVHALGLLFTELLTDRSPYPSHGGRVGAVDPERPTPARLGRDVGALEGVLAKAVSLRPQDRYADAGALLRALDAVLAAPQSSGRGASSPVANAAEDGGLAPSPALATSTAGGFLPGDTDTLASDAIERLKETEATWQTEEAARKDRSPGEVAEIRRSPRRRFAVAATMLLVMAGLGAAIAMAKHAPAGAPEAGVAASLEDAPPPIASADAMASSAPVTATAPSASAAMEPQASAPAASSSPPRGEKRPVRVAPKRAPAPSRPSVSPPQLY